ERYGPGTTPGGGHPSPPMVAHRLPSVLRFGRDELAFLGQGGLPGPAEAIKGLGRVIGRLDGVGEGVEADVGGAAPLVVGALESRRWEIEPFAGHLAGDGPYGPQAVEGLAPLRGRRRRLVVWLGSVGIHGRSSLQSESSSSLTASTRETGHSGRAAVRAAARRI